MASPGWTPLQTGKGAAPGVPGAGPGPARGGGRFEELRTQTHDHLQGLTTRPKELLKAAYALGYFETPRKVKLRDLAKMLDRGPSSVMPLLRRAERRVLEEAFG